MSELPKIIWIYWHQGENNAPEVVKRCIASWRKHNPGWIIHVLDKDTVFEHTGLPADWLSSRPDVSLQLFSDLIRVLLLSRQGGVWADASVFCSKPLDQWLPDNMQSGFFAFRGIRRGRLMGSPFLAAHTGSVVPAKLSTDLLAMFDTRRFSGLQTFWGKLLREALKPVFEISPRATQLWFTPFLMDVVKIYPYFTFHYLFNKLVLNDKEVADIWATTPNVPASQFLKLKHGSKAGVMTDDIRHFIVSGAFPVHKLVWQLDIESPYWAEVFSLLEQD